MTEHQPPSETREQQLRRWIDEARDNPLMAEEIRRWQIELDAISRQKKLFD